jgi:GH25 family lysozyme M1 (1,4-beta-N-acetylmuramidase)
LAEKEYGVKPLIYTGLTFYTHNLTGYVDDYPLWIAAYSGKHRLKNVNWTFHQFTENVTVKGVRTAVDGNDFKGDLEDLKKMCLN